MIQRLRQLGKKIMVSFCLSAAVLAIANVDTVWQSRLHQSDYNPARMASRQKFRRRLAEAAPATAAAAAAAKAAPDQHQLAQVQNLNNSLSRDEIADQNPFANLSTLDPLTAIMNKGIIKFQRQAYRSPAYRDEAGYDLVEYEIEHPDHSKSTIMAYLERPLVDDPSAAPERVPVVMIVRADGDHTQQTLYRDGNLMEQTELSLADAQRLVAQKLNAGVPFFSVAR